MTDTYAVSFVTNGHRVELGTTETQSAALVRAGLHAASLTPEYGELTTVECDDGFHACFSGGHHTTYWVFLIGGGMDDDLT
ncbi:hypothetical protein [Rhodococcus aetherivorans]|uniref:hypothetical protein n=1 Tax=Rhodococcus aetherivorans TaxID=191292 RepID=UPI00045CD96D|nr:hypothetical protein [Rhodococcus aetherivorans]KDE12433.1 hypothetical protein N505_0115405 [Rhodococcus aetherivorans]